MVVTEPTLEERHAAAVALGRLGGKKGGPARAKKLTPEQRSESARKAAQARWNEAKWLGRILFRTVFPPLNIVCEIEQHQNLFFFWVDAIPSDPRRMTVATHLRRFAHVA